MKIILNEYDFLTYDIILKDGNNIIEKYEGIGEMEVENYLVYLYYDYNLSKRTKVINPVFEGGELKDTYKITLDELFELWYLLGYIVKWLCTP